MIRISNISAMCTGGWQLRQQRAGAGGRRGGVRALARAPAAARRQLQPHRGGGRDQCAAG